MIHSFDTEHAKIYGLPCAVIIANFQWWINRNKANGENFREGRTWTYNSVKALGLVFDYLSADQIRRALDRLVTDEVLIKGVFNERASDRTTWFAFSDESIWLPPQVHLAKTTNGLGKSAKSTNRTVSKPVGNPDESSARKQKPFPLPDDFAISPAVEAWAMENGHTDLKAHFDAFVGKSKAKGYVYVDWDQAFQNAIREDWAKVAERKAAAHRPLSAYQQKQDRQQALLDRIQGGANANRTLKDIN